MQSLSRAITPPVLKRSRPDNASKIPLEFGHLVQPDSPGSPGSSGHSGPLSSLTIYSWNVNGIKPFLNHKRSTIPITEFLHSPATKATSSSSQGDAGLAKIWQKWAWPEIICLQELKVANQEESVDLIHAAVNVGSEISSHGYETYCCLPQGRSSPAGRHFFGVSTLVRRDLDGVSIRHVDWDLEGRVIICEVRDRRVAIFNIYALNGTHYDFCDSHTRERTGSRHERKRAFHSSLSKQAGLYQDRGWHIVIIGDFNISRTAIDSFPRHRSEREHVVNRADFEKKFIRDLQMIDSFRHLKGSEARKYTYRPTQRPWGSGGDRVDLALVGKSLKAHLSEADILDTPEDRGTSDHVPIYVKLSGLDSCASSDSICGASRQ